LRRFSSAKKLSIFIVLCHGFASSDKEYVKSSKFAS
jgi:hypothetical protein